MEKEFELYRQYRYAGRGSAWAVIIPYKRLDDGNVEVIKKSVSCTIKTMRASKINNLLSNNLVEDDTNISLVEESYIDEELCSKLVDEIKRNGGKLDKEEYKNIYNKIKD